MYTWTIIYIEKWDIHLPSLDTGGTRYLNAYIHDRYIWVRACSNYQVRLLEFYDTLDNDPRKRGEIFNIKFVRFIYFVQRSSPTGEGRFYFGLSLSLFELSD